MRHALVRSLAGVIVVAGVCLLLLQLPAVNRVVWPRPTPTPERFNPLAAALPEEVVQHIEPAPAGHTWQYQRDWDQSSARVCLVNATIQDGVIDPAVFQRL